MTELLSTGPRILTKDVPEEKLGGYDYDETYEGWYCVEITPLRCAQCNRPIRFLEPDSHHKVLVWEENDDEELLIIASSFKRQGYNPRVTEYKIHYGRAVEYYEAKAAGQTEWVSS